METKRSEARTDYRGKYECPECDGSGAVDGCKGADCYHGNACPDVKCRRCSGLGFKGCVDCGAVVTNDCEAGVWDDREDVGYFCFSCTTDVKDLRDRETAAVEWQQADDKERADKAEKLAALSAIKADILLKENCELHKQINFQAVQIADLRAALEGWAGQVIDWTHDGPPTQELPAFEDVIEATTVHTDTYAPPNNPENDARLTMVDMRAIGDE